MRWTTLLLGEEHLNNQRMMRLLVGVQIMILSFSSAGPVHSFIRVFARMETALA